MYLHTTFFCLGFNIMRNMQHIIGDMFLSGVSFMTYYKSDRAAVKIFMITKDGKKRSRWLEVTSNEIKDINSKNIEQQISNYYRDDMFGPIIGDIVLMSYNNLKNKIKGIVKAVGLRESVIITDYGPLIIPNKEIELENF